MNLAGSRAICFGLAARPPGASASSRIQAHFSNMGGLFTVVFRFTSTAHICLSKPAKGRGGQIDKPVIEPVSLHAPSCQPRTAQNDSFAA